MKRENLERDFDPLLPSQVFDKVLVKEPETGEQKLAWRLLYRMIYDVAIGKQKSRLKNIDEIVAWMGDPAPPFWDFPYFCEQLQLEEAYIRLFMTRFLSEQEEAAKLNKVTLDKTSLREKLKFVFEETPAMPRAGRHRESPVGSPTPKAIATGKGKISALAHLPSREGDLYRCNRCERIEAKLGSFSNNYCEGKNGDNSIVVDAGEFIELQDAGGLADLEVRPA